MRSDFVLAINQLCAERKLSPDVVMEAVQAALVSAYRRSFGQAANVEVRIEPSTGEAKVFAVKDVVEEVSDPKAEIGLADARKVDAGAQIGQTVLIESTPREFGRIAAQTAKQVILQRIREAERDALYDSFADAAGEIRHGIIQSIDFNSKDAMVSLEGAEAVLPAREQVSTETYRRGVRLRAYVLEVRKGSRGPQITLSRRTPALLRRLLELEVPEIANGAVEIKSIAREPGSRSKVAVVATQEGVDPVGSCVGVRGGRIQNVVNELGGEKIDVVQWHPDLGTYIANSLSPAKVMNVLLEDHADVGKTATVIVPDRQLSLAIGKDGQNARLAAKLTGWRIDIKSASEAAEETLGRFEDRVIAPEDMDLLTLAEVLLQKRDAAGLTEQERQLVEHEVEAHRDAGLPWPEEEPVLPAEPAPAPRSEPPAPQPEPDAAAHPEPALAEPLEAPLSVRRPFDDEEQVPTFEGEPIEDSIGWVQTAPEEDLYTGWQDQIEDLPEAEEEWAIDEIDGEEADRSGKKRKKKKSGKSRFGRPHSRDDRG